jgi:hypothetical protein
MSFTQELKALTNGAAKGCVGARLVAGGDIPRRTEPPRPLGRQPLGQPREGEGIAVVDAAVLGVE